MNSCPEEYHLCSLQELHSGGYHTARAMGWFKYENKFLVLSYIEIIRMFGLDQMISRRMLFQEMNI
jgi:hypothetical protein